MTGVVTTGDGRAASAAGDADGTGAAAAGAEPPAEPRVGVLLVRAWVEPDAAGTVRARLLTTEEGDTAPTTWATAAGDDAIGKQLQAWLHHLQLQAADVRRDDAGGGPAG